MASRFACFGPDTSSRAARRARCVALLVLVHVWPLAAFAGNDDEVLVGNRAAMVAGSVVATVRDSSAAWYNPAGLGGVERAQVDVSGSVYAARFYSVPKFLSAEEGVAQRAWVSEFLSVPAQVAFARELGRGLTLGLGYFAPRSTNFVMREQLDLGTKDTGSRWQIAATSSQIQHTVALGVGGVPAKNLRAGVSLIGGYALSTTSVSLFGEAHRNQIVEGMAVTTAISTSATASLEVGAGVQWVASPELTLGLALRSPRLLLRETARVAYSSGRSDNADGPATATSEIASNVHHIGQLQFLTAGRLVFGLAYQFSNAWLSGEIDVQPALSNAELGIYRRAFANARVGAYRRLGQHLAAGIGLFCDRSADARGASLLSGSGDFYGGTLGVEFGNEHLLAPSERVNSLVFSSVVALRYAYSNGDFGGAVVRPSALGSQGSGDAFGARRGDIIVHELGLYVGSGLNF